MTLLMAPYQSLWTWQPSRGYSWVGNHPPGGSNHLIKKSYHILSLSPSELLLEEIKSLRQDLYDADQEFKEKKMEKQHGV